MVIEIAQYSLQTKTRQKDHVDDGRTDTAKDIGCKSKSKMPERRYVLQDVVATKGRDVCELRR